MANQKATARGETFLGTFAEAIWAQGPAFLSVRIAEFENAGPCCEGAKSECTRPRAPLGRESCGTPESLRAASVYTTAILHLGALSPDAPVSELKTALDLANRAWWRLQEAEVPHLGRTA